MICILISCVIKFLIENLIIVLFVLKKLVKNVIYVWRLLFCVFRNGFKMFLVFG